jgi:hypothetical protein
MRYYKGSVCFMLEKPYVSEALDGRQTIVGYFRNFTVAAKDERSMRQVCESDGMSPDMKSAIDWAESDIQEISYECLSEACQFRADGHEGILYSSGRIFFPSEESPQP